MLDSSNIQAKTRENDLRAAVATLYEEHFETVWRWLNHLGVREADVDDAVHEVFVVVYRKYDTFEGRSKVTTWLFGICARVASDYRRRAHVRREQAGDSVEAPDEAALAPDDAAAAAQARAILNLALDTLDANKRAVFVLYELEGLAAPEIAKLVGCPLQTVYTRLYAARQIFRAFVARTTGAEATKGKP